MKMCGVNDIADAVAMRELFIKTYARRSVVCEICSLIVKYGIYSDWFFFSLYFHTIILHVCILPIPVNKR